MHGAGPRRGFAPDDARAGTGGGAGLRRVSAATRKTCARRYLALEPHEARTSVFRVSSAVTAKRLCARFEGVPLSVTWWWPRRAPQARSAPQLWAGRGRGNFEAQAAALASCPPGGRGRVELVSVGAATATELGSLPTGCFQPLGNPEAGRPPSRKPRAPSTGERTRGPPHRWWGGERVSGRGRGRGRRASHPMLAAHGGPAAPGRAHGTAAARPRRPGGPRCAEHALSFGDGHRRLWHERWDGSGFWRTWAKSCASRPLTCRRKTARALSPSERGEVTARGSRLSARGPASGRDQGGGASPRGKDKRDPR